jgi:hypothetical protein
MQARLVFIGSPGFPHTRKIVALMRYCDRPLRYRVGAAADRAGMPKTPVELLPTLYLPDAHGPLQAVTESRPPCNFIEPHHAKPSCAFALQDNGANPSAPVTCTTP